VLGRQAVGDVNGAGWISGCQVDSEQRYEHAVAVQFLEHLDVHRQVAHGAAAAEHGLLSEVIGRHQPNLAERI